MTIKLPKKPVPEFACLGCGVTRESIMSMRLNRHFGVTIAGTDRVMPLCSDCEADPEKMIALLSCYIEPRECHRQREIETVLWRVHNAAVARLKTDLDLGRTVLTLREVERRTHEQLSMIQRLELQAKRGPSLRGLIKSEVRGWFNWLARKMDARTI